MQFQSQHSTIENFYAHDLSIEHVHIQVSIFTIERDGPMPNSPSPLWLRSRIECCAEIIPTTAAVYNEKRGYLRSQFRLRVGLQENPQLFSEFRKDLLYAWSSHR